MEEGVTGEKDGDNMKRDGSHQGRRRDNFKRQKSTQEEPRSPTRPGQCLRHCTVGDTGVRRGHRCKGIYCFQCKYYRNKNQKNRTCNRNALTDALANMTSTGAQANMTSTGAQANKTSTSAQANMTSTSAQANNTSTSAQANKTLTDAHANRTSTGALANKNFNAHQFTFKAKSITTHVFTCGSGEIETPNLNSTASGFEKTDMQQTNKTEDTASYPRQTNNDSSGNTSSNYSSLESDALSMEYESGDADDEKADKSDEADLVYTGLKDTPVCENPYIAVVQKPSMLYHSTPKSDICENNTMNGAVSYQPAMNQDGAIYTSEPCQFERCESVGEQCLSGKCLEMDTILLQSPKQTSLPSPPTEEAKDYQDSKPKLQGDGYSLTSWFQKPKPCESNKLYVTHEYMTDSVLGDLFGATCQTYEGKEFNRHVLTDVQLKSPADLMKIKNNDEIVYIQYEPDSHFFVPKMSHTQVLNIFHHIPVNGTKLVIIIRRKVKGYKLLQWFESSAILNPDTRKVPTVEDTHFESVPNNVKTYIQNKQYKIQDTEYYLSLWGADVTVSPKQGGSLDNSKNIRKTTTISQDHTGQYIYYCTLGDLQCKSYVTIESQSVQVKTSEPQPFQFQMMGDAIYFGKDGMYLACEQEKITCSADCYFFDEMPGHPGTDFPDFGASVSSQDSVESGYTTSTPQTSVDERRKERKPLKIQPRALFEVGDTVSTTEKRERFTRSNTAGLSSPLNGMQLFD